MRKYTMKILHFCVYHDRKHPPGCRSHALDKRTGFPFYFLSIFFPLQPKFRHAIGTLAPMPKQHGGTGFHPKWRCPALLYIPGSNKSCLFFYWHFHKGPMIWKNNLKDPYMTRSQNDHLSACDLTASFHTFLYIFVPFISHNLNVSIVFNCAGGGGGGWRTTDRHTQERVDSLIPLCYVCATHLL